MIVQYWNQKDSRERGKVVKGVGAVEEIVQVVKGSGIGIGIVVATIGIAIVLQLSLYYSPVNQLVKIEKTRGNMDKTFKEEDRNQRPKINRPDSIKR